MEVASKEIEENAKKEKVLETKSKAIMLFGTGLVVAMPGVVASIIVPTLNEEDFIIDTLSSLVDQTVSRSMYEIIVSDSSSTDRTVEFAKELSDQVIVCKRHSAGFGRNFGANKAKGDYLGFVDADTIVSPTWVEGLVESLNKGYAMCSGPIDNIEKDSLKINLFFKWWNLQTWASVAIKKPIFPGFNFGIKRQVFDYVGGFTQENIVSEDIDLSLRIANFGEAVFNRKMAVWTSDRRQRQIPIAKQIKNGVNYFFNKKSLTWNEYRPDFDK